MRIVCNFFESHDYDDENEEYILNEEDYLPEDIRNLTILCPICCNILAVKTCSEIDDTADYVCNKCKFQGRFKVNELSKLNDGEECEEIKYACPNCGKEYLYCDDNNVGTVDGFCKECIRK